MAQPGSKISQGRSYLEQPNKAYQSTRVFNTGTGALYTYSTSLNSQFKTVGSLVINTNSSISNCPANRVVHANGKVLIPGVHVGGGDGLNPATGTGTTTPNPLPFPMIGVYDPVSGLNGYINPQDSTWAAYDASLSAFYDNAGTPSTVLAGQGAEPRFGAVFAGAASAADPGLVDIGAARTGTIEVANVAGSESIAVTSSEVTANSIIFLTYDGSSSTVILRVSALTTGSFTIASATGVPLAQNERVHFLIIN